LTSEFYDGKRCNKKRVANIRLGKSIRTMKAGVQKKIDPLCGIPDYFLKWLILILVKEIS
jgi:hypothetical protein